MNFTELIQDIEMEMEDIYNKDAEAIEDDDTLTAAEAGFMQGYLSA